jgi:hypothetical protein
LKKVKGWETVTDHTRLKEMDGVVEVVDSKRKWHSLLERKGWLSTSFGTFNK